MKIQNSPEVDSLEEPEHFAPHIVAGANYLFFIIPILALTHSPYNKNKNIRFHAYQSLIFQGFYMLILFAAIFMNLFFSIWGCVALQIVGMPLLAQFFSLFFSSAIAFLGGSTFLCWAYVTFSTFTKKKVSLPLIGKVAEQYANPHH